MLKLLNDLLNTSDNVTVLKLALKGITILCQEGVIDIITTLKVLGPRFKTDHRPQIAKKFYQILALAPTFQLENEDFVMFLKSNLTMLWKYAYDKCLDVKIKISVVEAMINFKLEHHEFSMIPGKDKFYYSNFS